MMRVPPCDVLMPQSLPELVGMLQQSNGETAILAGGSDLLVNLKHELLSPRQLLWLGKIQALREISRMPDGALKIGAMCTLAELAASPVVRHYCPSLVQAALSVASPAIRNRATLGGNLCMDTRCMYYNQSGFWRWALGGCLKEHVAAGNGNNRCHAAPGLSTCSAVFCSDTAPLLIALRASVKILGAIGERRIPLKALYRDDGMSHLTLEPHEIVTEIIIPDLPAGWKAGHKKIRLRSSIDFPLVNAGIAIEIDAQNICRNVVLCLGAVASAPVMVDAAPSLLVGNELTAERVERFGREAASYVHALPNMGVTAGYRKKMVEVMVRRVVGERRF